MKASGILRDMVKTTNLNRSLLIGNETGTFNSFDLEAYLDKPKIKKPFTYKEANADLILSIRNQMLAENERITRWKLLILLMASSLAFVGFSLLV